MRKSQVKSQVVRQNMKFAMRFLESSSKNLIAGSSGRSPPSPNVLPSPMTAESAVMAKLSLPATPAAAPDGYSGSMEA